jgi:hypothetical protein
MHLKNAIESITMIIGVLTFFYGIQQYRLKNSLERFEKFQSMATVYEDDEEIKRVRDELGQEGIASVPTTDRHAFMNFFEQLGLMMQSNLIQENVIYYTWGFDLRLAYQDDRFWNSIDKNDKYWRLFNVLAERMIAIDNKFPEEIPVEKFRF